MHTNWKEVQAEQVESIGHIKPNGNLYFWKMDLGIQIQLNNFLVFTEGPNKGQLYFSVDSVCVFTAANM